MLVLSEVAADISQGQPVSYCAPARWIDRGPMGHSEGACPSPWLHVPVGSRFRRERQTNASSHRRPTGCWPGLPGKLSICELVPSTAPASWHLTAPRQKDYVRANNGACQGKMRASHYKKGVFGEKFQPARGKSLIAERNPPGPAVPLSWWWEWASRKASTSSLGSLRTLKVCRSERSSPASVPTVV